jgi:hypothetical protein
MKAKQIIFLSALLMFGVVSCKCHKNQKEKPVTKTEQTTDSTYRFIVSFISKGAGIDSKSNDAIASYITTFNNQNDATVKYDKINWGKEGEMDYCFKLNELKSNKQEDFIKGFKNVTGSSDLILFTENHILLHKPRAVITETTTTTTTTTNLTTTAGTCRLIISFTSIGTGTDGAAIEAVENYITEYNKANNVSLAVEKYPWGREGEKDYCLLLTELSSDKQAAFIQGIREQVKKSTRVFIKENEVCKHKK